MTSDLDIYRSANELIEQHGDAADIEAAMRADERLATGDMEGITVRYTSRAGYIGMGGEGEHHHQGGSDPLQCGHGRMVHRIFTLGNAVRV